MNPEHFFIHTVMNHGSPQQAQWFKYMFKSYHQNLKDQDPEDIKEFNQYLIANQRIDFQITLPKLLTEIITDGIENPRLCHKEGHADPPPLRNDPIKK